MNSVIIYCNFLIKMSKKFFEKNSTKQLCRSIYSRQIKDAKVVCVSWYTHNARIISIYVTSSCFKLHRQMIQFTSVRFTQYLVRRSAADKRKGASGAWQQSMRIIRRREIKFVWRMRLPEKRRKSRKRWCFYILDMATFTDCAIL